MLNHAYDAVYRHVDQSPPSRAPLYTFLASLLSFASIIFFPTSLAVVAVALLVVFAIITIATIKSSQRSRRGSSQKLFTYAFGVAVLTMVVYAIMEFTGYYF